MNDVVVADVRLLKQADISGLGSTSNRNVLRVMERLEKEKLVKSLRKEMKLFSTVDGSFGNWQHDYMRNVYIVKKGLWRQCIIEPSIAINGEKFRPDFMIPKTSNPKNASDYVYYEVDRVQKKKKNMDKVKRYKRLGLQFVVICNRERVYMWRDYSYHVV